MQEYKPADVFKKASYKESDKNKERLIKPNIPIFTID